MGNDVSKKSKSKGFDWEKDSFPMINESEAVIYECHIKGLTMDSSSKVNNPGTFLGVQEKIDDLAELGINQLMLMPCYDFIDENSENIFGVPSYVKSTDDFKNKNYWGFCAGDYFTPKSSYALFDGEIEFKSLIKKAHSKNIEIIMMFYFKEDINTSELTRILIHWRRNYHVDGFMLNLNTWYIKFLSDMDELYNSRFYSHGIDEKVYLLNTNRFARYDIQYRTGLRKLLRGNDDTLISFIYLMSGNSKYKNINSITSHNGFTLNDLFSYNKKHNEANLESNKDGESYNFSYNCGCEGQSKDKKILNLRLRKMKNAIYILALSSGIPMFLAGDEEGNSQYGNNNAYCQDNEISWIQYGGMFSGELRDTLKHALYIKRKYINKFFKTDNQTNNSNKYGIPRISIHQEQAWQSELDNTSMCAGMMYADDDEYIYIALNFSDEMQLLALPHLPKEYEWSMIADTGCNAGKMELVENSHYSKYQQIHLPGNTIRVYVAV